MTGHVLPAALRAGADGTYTPEASAGLLITHAFWLDREDFASSFIRTGTSITDGTTEMAQIDWPAAITALAAGELPCSSSEQKMLQLAASLADQIPSTSARPAPASTTATSSSWSEPYSTPPDCANSRQSHDHLEVQRTV